MFKAGDEAIVTGNIEKGGDVYHCLVLYGKVVVLYSCDDDDDKRSYEVSGAGFNGIIYQQSVYEQDLALLTDRFYAGDNAVITGEGAHRLPLGSVVRIAGNAYSSEHYRVKDETGKEHWVSLNCLALVSRGQVSARFLEWI